MHSQRFHSFVDRLSTHSYLTEEERQALLALPTSRESIASQATIVAPEEVGQSCYVVVKGLLARISHTREGSRQILSFYVAGDMPHLQSLMHPRAIFGLFALCESEIVRIPHTALREVIKAYPRVSDALSRELGRESNIAFEWIVNLGRRTAIERIAHLFCEMAVKTGTAQERDTRFTFPITQTMLADAAGLSAVHVNRSLQALRKEKVLRFEQGYVEIPNWQALVDVAGFDGSYLESERSLHFANSG